MCFFRGSGKLAKKYNKSLSSLTRILERSTPPITGSTIYDCVSEELLKMAELRKGWKEREEDGIWFSMEKEFRPIPVPFKFNCVDPEEGEGGKSHMVGTERELRELSEKVKVWGKIWDEGVVGKGEERFLEFRMGEINSTSTTTKTTSNTTLSTSDLPTTPNTLKPPSWTGFSDQTKTFALEMQQPWATKLLENLKTIETRQYPLPPSLVNVRIKVIASQSNLPGVSVLKGNIFRSSDSNVSSSISVIGWVKFSGSRVYEDKNTFEGDVDKHLVTRESGYGWKEDTEVVHSWVVGECGVYEGEEEKDFVMVRRLRSIFEIERGGGEKKRKLKKKMKMKKGEGGVEEGGIKKKKKRF